MKRIEIGSWNVYELWEQEWPAFYQETHLEGFDDGDGATDFLPRPIDTHWFTNLQTEYFRQFAYSMGHLTLVPVLGHGLVVAGSIALWIYGAARLTWEWLS